MLGYFTYIVANQSAEPDSARAINNVIIRSIIEPMMLYGNPIIAAVTSPSYIAYGFMKITTKTPMNGHACADER